jgi:hypothetical protein
MVTGLVFIARQEAKCMLRKLAGLRFVAGLAQGKMFEQPTTG